jgi:hypothetical protein
MPAFRERPCGGQTDDARTDDRCVDLFHL